MDKPLKLGLLGFGTVGTGVYRILQRNRSIISARAGADFEVSKILVRDLDKPRAVEVDRSLLTTDPREIRMIPRLE